MSRMNGNKKRKGRKTNPAPPHIPPRDSECTTWVPFAKAMLMERDEISNRQRLFTAQIAINEGLYLPFEFFKLTPFEDNLSITLSFDDIIDGIIQKWNKKLLKWKGVQNRNNILKTIKWEGKNGYFHRARNYIDQYKNFVSDKLVVPILKQLITQINDVSANQYPQYPSLQESFRSCLLYSCLYSLFVSQITFFQCSSKPLIISTALSKNGQIRRYLASIDNGITIFDWLEQETESADSGTKVCERVRLRCIAYIKDALRDRFRAFHSMIDRMRAMKRIDFDAFKVNVEFDKEKKAKQYPEFNAAPIISRKCFGITFYSKTANKHDNTEPETEAIVVQHHSQQSVHKGSTHNHNNGSSREFQRVNRYGISRRINEERRSVRRCNSVETNIQQIRHNIMERNGPSQLELAQRENVALKREYRWVLQQLKSMDQECMALPAFGVGYDSSFGSIVSDNGVHMHCSAPMEQDVYLNQDQSVFSDPLLRDW